MCKFHLPLHMDASSKSERLMLQANRLLLADSSLLQSVLGMAVCFRPRAIAILFDGLGPLRGMEASHE